MSEGGKANDSHTLAKTIKGECAPTVSGDVCSDQGTLNKLREQLKIMARDPTTIVREAMTKTSCTTESCALDKTGLLENVVDRFRPPGPWKSTKWLDNQNIDQVLAQYALKYPRFKHVEFQMRDFATQGGELSRLNWVQLMKDYDALGCVLNTDLSKGGGEHWTPIFVDFRGGTVEYFDSAGQEPYKEFVDFIINVAATLNKTGRRYQDVLLTNVEHQMKNTECGVYSLYYILSRLHGVKYTAFADKRIPDDMMVLFRKCIFRNS
jgi:hypothetical protein